MEKKAKVSICPKCGCGIPVRYSGKTCLNCKGIIEKKAELEVKRINITQKSAVGKKPKLTPKKPASASPSKARTTSRKPKPKRR